MEWVCPLTPPKRWTPMSSNLRDNSPWNADGFRLKNISLWTLTNRSTENRKKAQKILEKVIHNRSFFCHPIQGPRFEPRLVILPRIAAILYLSSKVIQCQWICVCLSLSIYLILRNGWPEWAETLREDSQWSKDGS